MRIVNILFNYKKSTHDKRTLGVERCFIDHSKYLTINGNEVISITKPNMVYHEEIKKTGSKLLELPAFGQGDIFSMLRLAWLFLTFKPDAIVCHSGRAMFFARCARFFCFKKFPIIAIDHGINPKKFLPADYVLVVNSHFRQELINAGKSAKHVLVISNMVSVPDDFQPLVKPPFRKPLKLGSLGRIYSEKNFDKVLQAMAILRDRNIECEYVIGGIGPMERPLNELAQSLNLDKNFKILGWTTDKRKFFDEIDIFILPSFGETFGIVLLEAMLYSTPIITSNSWGPNDIIENEIDGIKVSKDDAKAMPTLLANAIEKLLNDQNLAKNLAIKASKKLFAQYSSDIVGKQLHNIIHKIVSEYD